MKSECSRGLVSHPKGFGSYSDRGGEQDEGSKWRSTRFDWIALV